MKSIHQPPIQHASFFGKKKGSCFVIILFLFLILSGCKDGEDPHPNVLIPTIDAFSPSTGSSGTEVSITGTNFSTTLNNNVVKFNGTTASISAATASSLTVSVPLGSSTGKITVEVGGKLATSVVDFTITLPVTITTFSPTTGATGTIVNITGANFSPTPTNNVVKFNGATASVTASTATSLTVTVPLGAATGKITIEVAGKLATSIADFIYIQTVDPSVSTVAGNGTLGFAEGDGAAARFYQPTGVALDASGNTYVADSENHRIRKISPTGTVSTFAGNGTPGFVNGTGSAAQFNAPQGVAVDASGNVYVADGVNNAIRKITSAGEVSTLAGSGNYGFADGDGAAVKFYFPKALAVDASGTVYVADDINHRIRKITPTGTVSTLAGDVGGYADGIGTAAQFQRPKGIALDAAGNVYVADAGNHRIRKITATGTVTTLAGSTPGYGEGIGASARFSSPVGVAVDAAGNVYVADDENERIRKITPVGEVSTFAGGFLSGFTDGSGPNAQFSSPTALAFDADGNLYVADRHNHSIRKIK